jgi:hypothetical protein
MISSSQLDHSPIRLRILHVENIFETQSKSLELGSYATRLGRGKICTFTVVTDLYQCLEQLQIKYYDLLIVHDQTPGFPVYDAMIVIKTAHPTLPVMLISQPSSEPLNFILAKCRQVGFTNVLRCPYTMDDYFFAINNMATALDTSSTIATVTGTITQRDGATAPSAQESTSNATVSGPSVVSRKSRLSRPLSPTHSSSSSSPLASSTSSSASSSSRGSSSSALSPSHTSHPLFSNNSHTHVGPGGVSSCLAVSPSQLHPSESQSHDSTINPSPLSSSHTTQPLFPPHGSGIAGSGGAAAGQFHPYPPQPYHLHHPLSYPHPNFHPSSGGSMFPGGACPLGTGSGVGEGAHYLSQAMYLPSSSPYPPFPHPHGLTGHPYQFYPSQPLLLSPHYSPMYPPLGPGPSTESIETVRTSTSTSAVTLCPESEDDEGDEGKRPRQQRRQEEQEARQNS